MMLSQPLVGRVVAYGAGAAESVKRRPYPYDDDDDDDDDDDEEEEEDGGGNGGGGDSRGGGGDEMEAPLMAGPCRVPRSCGRCRGVEVGSIVETSLTREPYSRQEGVTENSARPSHSASSVWTVAIRRASEKSMP